MAHITAPKEPKQSIIEIDKDLLNPEFGPPEAVFTQAKLLCNVAASKKGYTRPYSCSVRENGSTPNGFIDDYLTYCALQLVTRRSYDITGNYPSTRFKGQVTSWMAYANSMVRWWLIEYNKSVIDYSVLQLPEIPDDDDGSNQNNIDLPDTTYAYKLQVTELQWDITPKAIYRALEELPEDFDGLHYDILTYVLNKTVLSSDKAVFIVSGARLLIRRLLRGD